MKENKRTIDLEEFRKVVEEETLKIIMNELKKYRTKDGWIIMSDDEVKEFKKNVRK